MSLRNSFPLHDQGDESDDLDLLTLGNRNIQNSGRTAKKSLTNDTTQDNDEEPDWVREFSQSLPDEQQRRKALASQFDEDDDDSLIDLVPDDPDPLVSQPSLASDAQQSQKKGAEKVPLKRQKPSNASTSQMPLVMAPKLDESLVLLQSGDQSLDLSGDVGAVGRVKLEQGVLYMDIKGTIYKADTTACNTACVVSVGEDEAKVTAILDEAVTLVRKQNLFASAEIVVHGELTEEEGDSENGNDTQHEGESKSKKRKPSETGEKSKVRGAIKARAIVKNSRKKS